MITCSKCNKNLPDTSDYFFYYKSGARVGRRNGNRCLDCVRETNREWLSKNRGYDRERVKAWQKAHPEQVRLNANRRNREGRLEALQHYGGVCACCSEPRPMFLAFDHIDGGGNKHRKETGRETWKWLRMNNYPSGFRVLCHNCNSSRGYYGTCPHDTELVQQRDAFVAALGAA